LSWLKWLGESGLQLRGNPSLTELNFLLRWIGHQEHAKFAKKLQSAHQLIALSQNRLHQLDATETIEYEQSMGLLALFQTEKHFKKMSEKLATLKTIGVALNIVSQDDIPAVEPALNSNSTFFNAVHFPNDQVANCRQLALILKNRAQTLGVVFKFGSHVSAIQTAGSLAISVANDRKLHAFDQIVVATGSLGAALANTLKITLPVSPIGSYSLSARINEPLDAPSSAVLDISSGTTITRLGDRVRVSCGAKLGWRAKHDFATTQRMYHALQRLFPGAVNYSTGTQLWKSSYCLSMDGLPLIGPSSVPGIWFNIGHGANGWGMALGSAQLLANLVSKQPTTFDPKHFDPNRFTSK
jgi:D-amino-acid dehydrogenase